VKRRVTILGAISLTLLLATALQAQEGNTRTDRPAAAPPTGTREVGSGRPPVPAPDPRPQSGVTRLAPRSPAPPPVLTGVRAITLAEGEARLLIDGVERVVRPGDSVGADVVKSIAPGRMVLGRRAGTASEATVIVTFDARGEGHPLVLWSNNPAPHAPPQVP
jgi:hypothetical protein